MGQEIVYCYWCSSRILGTELDKGTAILIGNHACCSGCLPKVLASLPKNQRDTLRSELTQNTPRGGTEIASPRTPRRGSLLPGTPRETNAPVVLIAVAGGVLALGTLLAFVMSGGTAEQSTTRHEPAPPPRPVGFDREKEARDAVQKARDAARSGIDIDLQVRLWEEAVAKSERTASTDEATQERSAILLRRKEVYAQELTRLMDSVDGILRDDEFKKALEALAGARKRHELPDWTAEIDRKIADVKKLETSAAPYRQGTDAEGLICIEAENFTRKVDQGEHAWTLVTAPAGFSGPGAMSALPNKGSGWPTNYAATSPRLDFRIQFAKPGKYHVWVRGFADGGTDDSVHVGLDGAEIPSAAGIVVSGKKWAWTRRTMSNVNASLDVTAGIHTLNLWMREDGAIIDRILLTLDAKAVPKDPGPPETSR